MKGWEGEKRERLEEKIVKQKKKNQEHSVGNHEKAKIK